MFYFYRKEQHKESKKDTREERAGVQDEFVDETHGTGEFGK